LTLFALAAYNCGPGRVAALRAEAPQMGADPDVWFDNVERVAARRVGQETVLFVRSIYKYYVGYKLQLETLEARRAATGVYMPAAKKAPPGKKARAKLLTAARWSSRRRARRSHRPAVPPPRSACANKYRCGARPP